MTSGTKLILKSALQNGLFWSTVLVLLTYFKNGLINWNYIPFWFVFFALTGAFRRYYLLSKEE